MERYNSPRSVLRSEAIKVSSYRACAWNRREKGKVPEGPWLSPLNFALILALLQSGHKDPLKSTECGPGSGQGRPSKASGESRSIRFSSPDTAELSEPDRLPGFISKKPITRPMFQTNLVDS